MPLPLSMLTLLTSCCVPHNAGLLAADRTKLSIDGVEFLLMKALALHLIEGSIDQVRGNAAVQNGRFSAAMQEEACVPLRSVMINAYCTAASGGMPAAKLFLLCISMWAEGM